jgi:hypothetical protein
MDQMDSEDHPELSIRLSALEQRVLLSALSFVNESKAKDADQSYVVDVSLELPAGFIERFCEAFCELSSSWPDCNDPDDARSPMEFKTKTNTSDVGLWSMLPPRLYRRVVRCGKSPEQSLIDVVSQVLEFCCACSEIFHDETHSAWPDAPPLVLHIDSTHRLVASQRFTNEQDGERWLTHAKNAFNTQSFADALQEFDKTILGSRDTTDTEEREFPFPVPSDFYLLTRLEEQYRGWLPSRGLHVQDIRSIAKAMGRSGAKSCDKAVARCVASLRDRGYIVLQGEFESPDTKWLFPAECALTGVGYLRAKGLAGEE